MSLPHIPLTNFSRTASPTGRKVTITATAAFGTVRITFTTSHGAAGRNLSATRVELRPKGHEAFIPFLYPGAKATDHISTSRIGWALQAAGSVPKAIIWGEDHQPQTPGI